ncbi:fructosamine-3-kinase [Fulvimarina pelagi HTCC2506]|uniref:Fructosamine-3-kinase n=1 Tax=Fulvimarina pelagi HTCC2506 TaxID=314231 RepID=Q0G5I8_9HYPH|nr:fructosamine kinase family protein [Fulvimarina pelagi]EAU43076.1 fructosamine-3-kinase [Fulvimarina pelagi HTCC2506]
MNALAEEGARLLGGSLSSSRSFAGGSLSHLVSIELTDGRSAIVKGGPTPRAEARMLEAIRGSGAPAPEVFAADDTVFVMEIVEGDGSLSRAWASIGAAVRTLHAATGESYGWDCDFAFGAVEIPNGWSNDWPRFWAENRLLNNGPHIPGNLASRIEKLAKGLADRLPAAPGASLLHGDLWSGNVMASGDRITGLIDPACYYGHGEVDLAMLHLFGSPGAAFYAAYGELDPGYEDRRAIYTLWPALVHLRLFGSGYRGLVERLLDQLGV